MILVIENQDHPKYLFKDVANWSFQSFSYFSQNFKRRGVLILFDKTQEKDKPTVEHLNHRQDWDSVGEYRRGGKPASEIIAICCMARSRNRGSSPLRTWFNTIIVRQCKKYLFKLTYTRIYSTIRVPLPILFAHRILNFPVLFAVNSTMLFSLEIF